MLRRFFEVCRVKRDCFGYGEIKSALFVRLGNYRQAEPENSMISCNVIGESGCM
jgi:hypothetical protein